MRGLFETYERAPAGDRLLPPRYAEELSRMEHQADNNEKRKQARVRVIVDFLSRLTEQQSLDLYTRLTGTALGSITDPIIR